MSRIVGVKCYGYDWIDVYGLSMADAAGWLARHEVDWALIQNTVDPLPGSEVVQRLPTSAYDDVVFREHLRERGVRFYETTVVFHDPEAFAADPALRPVDAAGRAFVADGWYAGLCPSDLDYVKRKAERVAEAVDRYRPDGVFVSFIRFPGFWELWMPETARADIAEYCFCDRCLHRFQLETDITLPGATRAEQVRALQHELRRPWTAWKCGLVADAVRIIRAACGVPVLLNGFGLGTQDYSNAVEELLGQRFSALDPVVDHYELMFYFQIQRRDPAIWMPPRLTDAQSQSQRPILACLQAGPEYLAPKYAAGMRHPQITDDEWLSALRAAEQSGAAGVTVYSWRDLLADAARGGRRMQDLIAYRNGTLT